MPNAPLLEVAGTLREGDVIRFCYYHSFVRGRSIPFALGVHLLVSTFVSLIYILDPAQLRGYDVWAVVLPIAWAVLLLITPVLQARSQYRKTPALRELVSYRFGDETVEAISSVGNGTVAWKGLESVRETGSAMILYHSPHYGWVIPKRFIGSSGETEQLRALACRSLAEPSLMKAPGWLSSRL